MTNAALQKIIDDHGPDIFCFFIDNEQKILFGYNSKDTPKIDDVTLETIEGIDFFKIQRVSHSHGKAVYFHTLHRTECIQWVGYMDEKSTDYRVDPLIFR